MTRMDSTRWSTPGGDLAELVGIANASNVPGSKLTYDVTELVQQRLGW